MYLCIGALCHTSAMRLQRCLARPGAAQINTDRGIAPLAGLPDDVVTRVLHGLSAADLTSCARTCRRLRRMSVDESLWRRLYCFRWRYFKGGEAKVPHAHFWKVRRACVRSCVLKHAALTTARVSKQGGRPRACTWLQVTYMQRDESEFVANVLRQPDARLQEQYRSMQLTERCSPVTAVREPSWSVQTASAQEQLAGYLRSRGFSSDVRVAKRASGACVTR